MTRTNLPGVQIRSLKAHWVSIPTAKPYEIATVGVVTSAESVILELQTDEGVVGLGETDPSPMFSGETCQSVMSALKDYLGPAILGMNPLEQEAIHEKMECVCPNNYFAHAAVDLACYDIAGKILGVPVYALLGGKLRDKVSVMWSLGNASPRENAREARTKAAEGYWTVGLKLGVQPLEVDIDRVAAVREAVGPHVLIRCDANQGWTVVEAIKAITCLEEYGVAMIEQPVPAWDITGLAEVRSKVKVPISIDESLCTIHDAVQAIRARSADVFSIKTTKNGGLLKAKKIAAIAEAAGLEIFVNSMIELGISVLASLHFAVSTPGLCNIGHALNSVRRMSDDILEEPLAYAGGEIAISSTALGLGAVLDVAKLKKYRKEQFFLQT